MSTNHADHPISAKPQISVIIPLEHHRGQWERCWQSWNTQTVDKSVYEIILVVTADFQEHTLLNERSAACLEFSSSSNDTDLCAVGAIKARGRYLLFTEAHCWPEPDVLKHCLEAINVHPDWAGFSCLSLPITHNRLSKASANMYLADIEHAVQVRSRPKNLYQCFVTRREAYEHCGGFKSGLGHFAEWVLAASYFQRGYKIGYFPNAKFHHYYSGSISEIRAFTLNFVTGEVGYFGGGHYKPNESLLEIPPEWICWRNFDRNTARAVLHIAVKSLYPLGKSYRRLPRSIMRIGRWILPAIFGDRIVRISAAAAAVYARITLLLAHAAGSQKRLNDQFRKYIAALIRAQRLTVIGSQGGMGRDAIQPSHVGSGLDVPTLNATGFYPLEQFQGSQFRWSETAAAVHVFVPAGLRRIRIDCIPARDLFDAKADFRFFVDGVRIPSSQLSIETDRISIELNITRPQIITLGWTCRPFLALADPRQLGLPIKRIDLNNDPVTSDDSFKRVAAFAS